MFLIDVRFLMSIENTYIKLDHSKSATFGGIRRRN